MVKTPGGNHMKLFSSMLALAGACIAVFSVALFFSGGAVAQDSNSANSVMVGCRDLVADSNRDKFTQGLCGGGITAILALDTRVCRPQAVTNVQALQVVIAYIDARPARLHESFYALALEALRNAWPCR
jgi:hypothetical protein